MISINVHYSNDRLPQLEQLIRHIDNTEFARFEKIIISDGLCNINPYGWKIINVHRTNLFYCRAKVWDIGVKNSNNDIILYLDSDRLLDQEYIRFIRDTKDMEFIFPKDHVENGQIQPRTLDINKIISVKNPMSGCVAFTKKTYYTIGGPDQRYLGWRFMDIDYFKTAIVNRCQLKPFNGFDTHLPHKYTENPKIMELMYLWNGLKYYQKLEIPIPTLFSTTLPKHLNITPDIKLIGDFLLNYYKQQLICMI